MAFDPAIEIDITDIEFEFGTAYVADSGFGAFSVGVELPVPDPEIEFGTYSCYVESGGPSNYASSFELDALEIEFCVPYVTVNHDCTWLPGVEGLTSYAILWPGGDGVHIFPSVEIVWEWPEPADIRGTGIGFELTQDSGIEFAETIQIAGRGIGIEFAMEL